MRALILHHLKLRPALSLLMLAALACLIATGLPYAPSVHAAGSDPIIHWDSSMIYPGQNSGYPWGPVGEQVTVHGEKFTASGVVGQPIKLQLVAGDVNNPPGGGSSYEFCKLAGPKIPLQQVTVDGSGKFDSNFTWPAAAGSGMFSICAYNTLDGLPVGNIDDGPFTVLSSSAPSVAVSRTTVPAGETVTVTGKNWTPPQDVNVYIAACADCDGPVIVAGTAHSSGLHAGTFSITFTIPSSTPSGDFVAGANAHSVLDVGPSGAKHLTITAATPPTPTSEPTTTQSTAVTRNGAGNGANNSGGGTIGGISPLVLILLGVGLLLLLLLIIIVVLVARRGAKRTPPGGTGGRAPGRGGSGPSPDGYAGYGPGAPQPAGGSVQQNWSTLAPGWGEQTPPTVTQGSSQRDASATSAGYSQMVDPVAYPPAPPAAYPPASGDTPTQPGHYPDAPPDPYHPYSG